MILSMLSRICCWKELKGKLKVGDQDDSEPQTEEIAMTEMYRVEDDSVVGLSYGPAKQPTEGNDKDGSSVNSPKTNEDLPSSSGDQSQLPSGPTDSLMDGNLDKCEKIVATTEIVPPTDEAETRNDKSEYHQIYTVGAMHVSQQTEDSEKHVDVWGCDASSDPLYYSYDRFLSAKELPLDRTRLAAREKAARRDFEACIEQLLETQRNSEVRIPWSNDEPRPQPQQLLVPPTAPQVVVTEFPLSGPHVGWMDLVIADVIVHSEPRMASSPTSSGQDADDLSVQASLTVSRTSKINRKRFPVPDEWFNEVRPYSDASTPGKTHNWFSKQLPATYQSQPVAGYATLLTQTLPESRPQSSGDSGIQSGEASSKGAQNQTPQRPKDSLPTTKDQAASSSSQTPSKSTGAKRKVPSTQRSSQSLQQTTTLAQIHMPPHWMPHMVKGEDAVPGTCRDQHTYSQAQQRPLYCGRKNTKQQQVVEPQPRVRDHFSIPEEHRYGEAVGGAPDAEEEWIMCPLCMSNYPAHYIEIHAATCMEP